MGVVVKEELCEKVLEVRRVSDSDNCCCFQEKELRLICGYGSQSGRRLEEKLSFYDELK